MRMDARPWYHRLTLNQERDIETVIGEFHTLNHEAAIELVTASRKPEAIKNRLIESIVTAAKKSGCSGEQPLVDERLVEHMRAERQRRFEERNARQAEVEQSA